MSNPAIYGAAAEITRLDYLAVEISWGSRWINLNDHIRYQIAADGTRDNTSETYRKTTVQSPILGGEFLVHAVPEMVTETLGIWIYGETQTDLSENFAYARELFSQWSFRLRWTLDDARETWNCQLPDANSSRNQIWTHNLMARQSYTIPRFSEVTYETVGG